MNKVQDGALFFRVLIGKCYVDRNATIEQLQRSLRNLPAYMTSISSNISEFNIYVEDITNSLAARSVEYMGIITVLYNRYQAANNAKFVSYIENRYNSHMDR